MAKNAEYDSAWCANNEKTIFEPIENSVLKIEIFWPEIEEKKISLKLENWIG